MADGVRLDKFLWFARIVKTRALAQTLAEDGRIRIGGRVVDRAHCPVRVGDVLSFAQRGEVRVLRIEALPARRGPPAEARALYTEIADGAKTPLPEGEREGPAKREGEGLQDRAQSALTSHRFAAGPSSPLQGEG